MSTKSDIEIFLKLKGIFVVLSFCDLILEDWEDDRIMSLSVITACLLGKLC